jgi:TonB-dependent receptor
MRYKMMLATLLPMAAHISTAFAQQPASAPTQPASQERAAQAPEQSAAQAVQPPAADPAPVETVVVTGFRSSLERALNLKQAAVGVRDSIVAEDIGKFPEANVAESLQRIPGVYLTRDPASGEGQRVNIRGLGPQYAVTTFNGAPVQTTSSANAGSAVRDFNYDVFPSELFGRVDFYKTPLAELTEGGIGGNVDLQPLRPFDRKGRTIRYAVSAVYNDASQQTDPRYSLVLSNTWGNFGALVGYAHSGTQNQRSGFQTTNQYNTSALGAQNRGPFTFGLDYDDPRANLGGLTRDQVDNAFLPRFARAYAARNERSRDGLVTSLQYKTPDLELAFDGVFARLSDERDENTFGLAIRNSRTTNRNVAEGAPGRTGMIPTNVFIDEYNNLQGTFANTTYSNENYFYDSRTKFDSGALNLKYRFSDRLRLSGQVATSNSAADFSANRIYTSLYGVTSTLDTTKNLMYPTLTSRVDIDNGSLYRDPLLGYAWAREKDGADTFRIVAEYDYELPFGFAGKLKSGLSRDRVGKEVEKRNGTAIGTSQPLSVGGTVASRGSSLSEYMVSGSPFENYAADAPSTFPTSWAYFTRDFMENVLDPNRANAAAPVDTAQSFRTVEDVKAFFVQSDFTGEVAGRELRVNAGVRYVRTNTYIDNYIQSPVRDAGGNPTGRLEYVPNRREGSYKNLLPMLSAAYDILPDVVIRASAGKTLTRAPLSIIAANTVIPEASRTNATSGNPDLKPQLATQFDVTGEWYFRRGSLFSVGLFTKKLKDTTVAQVTTVPFSSLGLPDSALAPNLWDPALGRPNPNLPISLSTYFNSGERRIRGVELAYQQAFNFLPAPFDGLGTILSYTRVDAPIDPWLAPDGRKHEIWEIPRYSYSATVYYEKGKWALRSSYNYKDRSITNVVPTAHGLQNWLDARGYLDASISYQISDKLEVRLDGLNLNDGDNRQYFRDPSGRYGDGRSRAENLIKDGRVIMLGLRGKY